VVGVRVGRAVASGAGWAGPNEALQPTGAAILVCQVPWFSTRPRRLNFGVRQKLLYAHPEVYRRQEANYWSDPANNF